MDPPNRIWYLEGFADGKHGFRRVPVPYLPFVVGRRAGLDLTLNSSNVSQEHAELFEEDGRLMVRDLGSTNGTFVNRERLTERSGIEDGDTLHFATEEYRLGHFAPGQTQAIIGTTSIVETELPKLLLERMQQFRDLIEREAVGTLFQPIVSLTDDSKLGYEALGRGRHEGLPSSIGELFELAAVVGTEADLSRLLRAKALSLCTGRGTDRIFFFNTHPAELRERGLVGSLRGAREDYPELPMALELHEAAVTDPASILRLKQDLAELDIRLAYDDFGTGQARLAELAAAPPDYLKFDISLIRDIDRASDSRRRVVENLIRMAQDLGVVMVAEGLESPEEAETCRDLGFAYGQGFLWGQPLEADALT